MCLCTTTLTAGGTSTIELGVSGDLNWLIDTMSSDEIDATEVWCSATAADNAIRQYSSDCMFDIILDGEDIGYDINTANVTAGVLKFICWWKPLEFGATVIPAVGTATL